MKTLKSKLVTEAMSIRWYPEDYRNIKNSKDLVEMLMDLISAANANYRLAELFDGGKFDPAIITDSDFGKEFSEALRTSVTEEIENL